MPCKQREVVQLSASDDELVDKDTLFSSNIPELRAALQDPSEQAPDHMRRRIRKKTSEVLKTPELGLKVPDLAGLTQVDPADISPQVFKNINASLKQENKNKKSNRRRSLQSKSQPSRTKRYPKSSGMHS